MQISLQEVKQIRENYPKDFNPYTNKEYLEYRENFKKRILEVFDFLYRDESIISFRLDMINKYTGYDIEKEMSMTDSNELGHYEVNVAKQKYPDDTIRVEKLVPSTANNKYDYTLISYSQYFLAKFRLIFSMFCKIEK